MSSKKIWVENYWFHILEVPIQLNGKKVAFHKNKTVFQSGDTLHAMSLWILSTKIRLVLHLQIEKDDEREEK